MTVGAESNRTRATRAHRGVRLRFADVAPHICRRGELRDGRTRRGDTAVCPYSACILDFTEAVITLRVGCAYAGATLIAVSAILPRCEK